MTATLCSLQVDANAPSFRLCCVMTAAALARFDKSARLTKLLLPVSIPQDHTKARMCLLFLFRKVASGTAAAAAPGTDSALNLRILR